MTSAAAASGPPTEVLGTKVSSGGPGTEVAANESSALPRTGTEAAPVVAVGAGAVALGAAAVVAARKLKSSDGESGEQTI